MTDTSMISPVQLNAACTVLQEALRIVNVSVLQQSIRSPTDITNSSGRRESLLGDQSQIVTPHNESIGIPLIVNEFEVKFCELEASVETIRRSNAQIQGENEDLKYQLDESWVNIKNIERDLNLLQQYNRRENIEISGISDSIEDHELEGVIMDILRRIGVYQLEDWEISGCHRLKKRSNDRYCNVIVRFVNRKRAHQCLRQRKYLKDTIWEHPNIYIHENLCPRYRSIFEKCENLKARGMIKKVWTYNGIVNYKKSDNLNERPKKIFHDSDFNNYFPDTWD